MHPPRYWRMRAEEFRTKADNCEYPETRDVLRKVAENYDELARRAARIITVESLDERAGGGEPANRKRARPLQIMPMTARDHGESGPRMG
ncbi:hypothetical protein [Bradyrhizobium sp. WSM471]|uniref:hypothetical protein n=1 Tax=Bradyrhizobium sp. WSM471 TaxID=319017 RepID=UPI001FDA3EED|nr:hypothetical protein [Bradyrhizobium sp. WSM471]